jgi:uncharacterized Zn-binding protein involved in type VI secretion
MPQAARVGDPIGHSPTMDWLIKGALAGAAIVAVGVLVVGTGGLGAVALTAVVGGAVAGGAGIGEVLSTMSFAPKEVCGVITPPCSSNVFINGKAAARAHVDMARCAKHPQVPLPISSGSETVFINGLHAARVGDTIQCSAVITDGSANVFIGGGNFQTDVNTPENLVPPAVHIGLFIVGAGSALVLFGPVVAIGGLVGGYFGGRIGGELGGLIFGEESDGQKWGALGGSIVGGMLGGKYAPNAWELTGRVQVSGLGMGGGNIRLSPKPLAESPPVSVKSKLPNTEPNLAAPADIGPIDSKVNFPANSSKAAARKTEEIFPVLNNKENFSHTLKDLPENWVDKSADITIAPTQENASAMASRLATWATEKGATEGAATVHIDPNGKIWVGLSKNAGKAVDKYVPLDNYINSLNKEAGVKYWGTCAELQSYTQFAKSVGSAPIGGYTGAAQVGNRMGVAAGTPINACPSCSYVNGKLGVGHVNHKGDIVPPVER